MNSCETIQNWIFQHACKYDMFNLLFHFFKEENWDNKGRLNSEYQTEMHNYALSLSYMKCVVQSSQQNPAIVFKNLAILELLTELIPQLFKAYRFISISKFLKLMKWIKTLLLLVSLEAGEDIITDKVRIHFPNDVKEYVTGNYNIDKFDKINKLAEDYKFLRQYIYMICKTPASLEKYLKNKFHVDLDYISNKIKRLLAEFVNAMVSKCPVSPLDQISAAVDNPSLTTDATIELFCEHFKDKMKEEELIELLNLFFPQNYSQLVLADQSYQSITETQKPSEDTTEKTASVDSLDFNADESNGCYDDNERSLSPQLPVVDNRQSSDDLFSSESSTDTIKNSEPARNGILCCEELLSQCREFSVLLERVDPVKYKNELLQKSAVVRKRTWSISMDSKKCVDEPQKPKRCKVELSKCLDLCYEGNEYQIYN